MRLEIRGIRKSFGVHTALDQVDISIESARSVVFIGPSGGGKSTLLRILAGLERPDAGSISLDGEAMGFDEPSLRRHRLSVGTVFQAFNLFPHLTAIRNITLPLEKVHGLSAPEARERAMETLSRFQLEPHAEKKPAALSGGQRQRVAIARAVSIRPRLLLFDEPTSALDPEMTAEVLDLIGELRDAGRDLVIVTHQMGFARRVADAAVFLADGRVLESGPGEALFANPSSGGAQRFLARILKY